MVGAETASTLRHAIVSLDYNGIGNDGVQALDAAVPQCPSLQQLE